MQAQHVILTRFSVKAAADAPPHPDDWLEHRLTLLTAFCVPGLAQQTESSFEWHVYCDASTPRWCLGRLAALTGDVPQLRVALTQPGISAVERLQLTRAPILVTTRIDSDDGTSTDLVERVAAYAPAFEGSGHAKLVLNFSRGCKLETATGRVFETFHPLSPHLTMFERTAGGVVTVQSGNHGRMQEAHVVHQDAGPPAWLQVVHGGNLSNHIHATDSEAAPGQLQRFAVDPSSAAAVPEAPAPPQPKGVAARAAFRQGLEDALLPPGDAR